MPIEFVPLDGSQSAQFSGSHSLFIRKWDKLSLEPSWFRFSFVKSALGAAAPMRNVKPARVPKQRKVHKLLRFGKARCFIFYLLGIFSLSFLGRSSEESWRRSRLDGSKPVGRPSPYIIINVILGTLVFVATPIEVDQRDTLHRIFKSKTSFFYPKKGSSLGCACVGVSVVTPDWIQSIASDRIGNGWLFCMCVCVYYSISMWDRSISPTRLTCSHRLSLDGSCSSKSLIGYIESAF